MYGYERDALIKYTYQKIGNLNKRIDLIEEQNRLLKEQNAALKELIRIQNELLGANPVTFDNDEEIRKVF